jgi:predicted nucleic acid-binding protein
MPTRSRTVDLLLDTSAAVALVVSDHVGHAVTMEAVGRRRLGLAGHAAFETFSVLTRLPPPARRTASVIGQVLHENFPGTRYLSPAGAARLFARLPALGIAGGSVYDALVGATAAEHGLPLATRDRRALNTYRALEVNVELVE